MTTIFFYLFALTLYAQTLVPFEGNNGKWGYKDKTGKVVIELKYDFATSFSEGLASVNLDGKWGVIDKTGNVIIDFKYDDIHPFHFGITAVTIGKKSLAKSGFMDNTGKELTPIKYDWFSVKGLNSKDFILVKLNKKYGFIDRTGKEIIPIQFDFAKDFINGRAEVTLNDVTFYIDKTGQEVK